MAKKNISIRLNADLVEGLEAIARETGLSLIDVATEAIATYLNKPVPHVGDRLTLLEKQMAELKGKLRLLSLS